MMSNFKSFFNGYQIATIGAERLRGNLFDYLNGAYDISSFSFHLVLYMWILVFFFWNGEVILFIEPLAWIKFLPWRDSREVRCVHHTTMIDSAVPWLRDAVPVRINAHLIIVSALP